MFLYCRKKLISAVLLLSCLLCFILFENETVFHISRSQLESHKIRLSKETFDTISGEKGRRVRSEKLTANNSNKVHNDVVSEDFPTSGSAENICARSKPTKQSVELANKVFFTQPPPECMKGKQWEPCIIKVKLVNVVQVRCDISTCPTGHISLGVTNHLTGELAWTKFTSVGTLEDRIMSLMKKDQDARRNFGYCLIRCAFWPGTVGTEDVYNPGLKAFEMLQLLILPPLIATGSRPESVRSSITSTHQINVSLNIIHIDSLSRDHFKRSLPKTNSILKRLNGSGFMGTEVIDFTNLQTIKARTFETLKMLFAGELPKPTDLMSESYDPDELPFNTSIAFNVLFGAVKRRGGQTLYMDDLCWNSEWGIGQYLGIRSSNSSWNLFLQYLNRNYVDDIGPSLSSCFVYKHLNLSDPFQGPEKICFNDYHQHKYLLEYLKYFQEAMRGAHRTFMTFLMTNIAHEPSGRRVQTLDSELANYLSNLQQMSNVVTVITADHGNTYGEFVEQTFQGRLESFNPPFFLIIPRIINERIGEDWLRSLKSNQNSLITHLDIHLFLKSLAEMTVLTNRYPLHLLQSNSNSQLGNKSSLGQHSRGKQTSLSSTNDIERVLSDNPLLNVNLRNRTCADVQLLADTICLCEGHYTLAIPKPSYQLLAHFAVGEINNIIWRTRVVRGVATSRCLPLLLDHVRHTWIRHEHGIKSARISLVAKVDLMAFLLGDRNTRLHGKLDNLKEMFTVTMKWTVNDNPGIILTSISRTSVYGLYKSCADEDVHPKLCVCIQPIEDRLWVNPEKANIVTGVIKMPGGALRVKPSDHIFKRTRDSKANGVNKQIMRGPDANKNERKNAANDISDDAVEDKAEGSQYATKSLNNLGHSKLTRGQGTKEYIRNDNTPRDPENPSEYFFPTVPVGRKTRHENPKRMSLLNAGQSSSTRETVQPVSGSSCLQVLVLRLSTGAGFRMRNVCEQDINFYFNISLTNMDMSIKSPVQQTISAHSVWSLGVCVHSKNNLGWRWKYDARQI